MAKCPTAKKKVTCNTSFLGGPFDTRDEALAAMYDGVYLVAYAETDLCEGTCEDRCLCQLLIDKYDRKHVVGPFARPKAGQPNKVEWFYAVTPGMKVDYHCECLPPDVGT
jgi:hypothetical protein